MSETARRWYKHPLSRVLSQAIYPLLVLACWQTFGFEITTYALIVAGAVASAVFIISYRPFDLRSHGPAGKNLLVMTWSTFLLFFLTILFNLVDLPQWLEEGLSLLTIGGIVYAVVQRVVIWRSVRRDQRELIKAQDANTRT